MIVPKNKEIIVNPTIETSKLSSFLSELKHVRIVNINPKLAKAEIMKAPTPVLTKYRID